MFFIPLTLGRKLPWHQACNQVLIEPVLLGLDALEYLNQFGDGLFKDDQAAEIVGFVEGIKDKAKGILLHCEAGVSRSAAVAAVIELVLNGSNEEVLKDGQNSPAHTIIVPVF